MTYTIEDKAKLLEFMQKHPKISQEELYALGFNRTLLCRFYMVGKRRISKLKYPLQK
jgi:hypothetical protein